MVQEGTRAVEHHSRWEGVGEGTVVSGQVGVVGEGLNCEAGERHGIS